MKWRILAQCVRRNHLNISAVDKWDRLVGNMGRSLIFRSWRFSCWDVVQATYMN